MHRRTTRIRLVSQIDGPVAYAGSPYQFLIISAGSSVSELPPDSEYSLAFEGTYRGGGGENLKRPVLGAYTSSSVFLRVSYEVSPLGGASADFSNPRGYYIPAIPKTLMSAGGGVGGQGAPSIVYPLVGMSIVYPFVAATLYRGGLPNWTFAFAYQIVGGSANNTDFDFVSAVEPKN